jgi:hypothetical protein
VKRDVFLSHEEVEGMLGITLQETRIYREFKEEGRREREAEMLPVIVPALLKAGMRIEQIAEQLKVEIEVIRQTAQENGWPDQKRSQMEITTDQRTHKTKAWNPPIWYIETPSPALSLACLMNDGEIQPVELQTNDE